MQEERFWRGPTRVSGEHRGCDVEAEVAIQERVDENDPVFLVISKQLAAVELVLQDDLHVGEQEVAVDLGDDHRRTRDVQRHSQDQLLFFFFFFFFFFFCLRIFFCCCASENAGRPESDQNKKTKKKKKKKKRVANVVLFFSDRQSPPA